VCVCVHVYVISFIYFLLIEKEIKIVTSNDDKKHHQTTNWKIPLNSKIKNTSLTSKVHDIKCPDWYNCLNDGTCVVDLVVGPKCLCTEDFMGLNCGKGYNDTFKYSKGKSYF
jgi:hypothetical protein